MNRVEISAEDGNTPEFEGKCRIFVENVLEYRGIHGWEVSILFCGNDMIHALNKQYRDKDSPTDVLTFSQLEDGPPQRHDGYVAAGDIVISTEYIAEHAGEYGVTKDNELKRLLVHGILHLEGMDHATNDVSEKMLILQEDILNRVKGENIL